VIQGKPAAPFAQVIFSERFLSKSLEWLLFMLKCDEMVEYFDTISTNSPSDLGKYCRSAMLCRANEA
jgi:hypothetical protein